MRYKKRDVNKIALKKTLSMHTGRRALWIDGSRGEGAMGRLFALIGAVALAACADDPWVWTQSGSSAMPLQQAQYECERDTRISAASFGYGVMAQVYARDFAIRCMATKGWHQQSTRASNFGAPDPAYVRYREDLSAWFERWEGCKAKHRTAAAREKCVGQPPLHGAAAAPSGADSYQARLDRWFKRFHECDAESGNANSGNTRLGCSGLPPTS